MNDSDNNNTAVPVDQEVTNQESPDNISDPSKSSPVDEQMVIESSIKNHMRLLDQLEKDMKIQKEMMKSYLENDDTYVKAVDAAKKAAGLKNQAKKVLLTAPAGAELNGKIKSLSDQKKELQEGLSYYLREYQRLTGLNHFEGEDGEVREIVYTAKLVRRNVFEK